MTRVAFPDTRQLIAGIAFVAAFIAVSYGVHRYQSDIVLLLGNGGLASAAAFIFLTALFVVFIIPLDIVLLIPLGVGLWGSVPTALMSITGWTLGALIAFGIAREYGLPLVKRLIGERRATMFEKRIPTGNLFWSVVFLRLLVPVDLLSYALGLFSALSWRNYLLATALGVTPFGFFFAFVGALPSWYQVVALSVALVCVSFLLARATHLKGQPVSDDGRNRIGRE